MNIDQILHDNRYGDSPEVSGCYVIFYLRKCIQKYGIEIARPEDSVKFVDSFQTVLSMVEMETKDNIMIHTGKRVYFYTPMRYRLLVDNLEKALKNGRRIKELKKEIEYKQEELRELEKWL